MGFAVINLTVLTGRKTAPGLANAVSSKPQRASSAHRWFGLVVIEVAV